VWWLAAASLQLLGFDASFSFFDDSSISDAGETFSLSSLSQPIIVAITIISLFCKHFR